MCLLGRCLLGSRPKRHFFDHYCVPEKTPLVKGFGQRVKEIREKQGISQEELAHRAGLHRTGITRVERCTRVSSLETVEKIAHALQVQPRDLLPEIRLKRPRSRKVSG